MADAVHTAAASNKLLPMTCGHAVSPEMLAQLISYELPSYDSYELSLYESIEGANSGEHSGGQVLRGTLTLRETLRGKGA